MRLWVLYPTFSICCATDWPDFPPKTSKKTFSPMRPLPQAPCCEKCCALTPRHRMCPLLRSPPPPPACGVAGAVGPCVGSKVRHPQFQPPYELALQLSSRVALTFHAQVLRAHNRGLLEDDVHAPWFSHKVQSSPSLLSILF